MNKLLFTMLAVMSLVWASCSDDDSDGPDLSIDASIALFSITDPLSSIGVIDAASKTIIFDVPAGTDVSAMTVNVSVANGATVSPETGSVLDFTNPVTFSVTGADASGEPVSEDFTVTANFQEPQIGFIGTAADITGLEDDAMAAATFLSSTYGENFHYLQASAMTAAEIADLTVMIYYFLETGDEYRFAEADVVAKAAIIKDWAKKGGDLFLAGGGASLVFDIGRLPIVDYPFLETVSAGVEGGKPQDDYWGLSFYSGIVDGFDVPVVTSDVSEHPIFDGIGSTWSIIERDPDTDEITAQYDFDESLFLGNSDSREVMLVGWTDVGSFPSITAGCCGIEMIQEFENQTRSRKLGSLRHVLDGWGLMFAEFEGTAQGENHADLNTGIPTDWKGNVVVLCNHIVGYEWDTSTDAVRANEYDDNIEKFTTNIVDYLAGLNNN